MPQQIQMGDTTYEFPDGMSEDDMKSALDKEADVQQMAKAASGQTDPGGGLALSTDAVEGMTPMQRKQLMGVAAAGISGPFIGVTRGAALVPAGVALAKKAAEGAAFGAGLEPVEHIIKSLTGWQ